MPRTPIRGGHLAALLIAVPLGSDQGWEVLRFSRIPANNATFSEAGLRIEVKRSASPLIYRLPTPRRLQRLRAHGRLEGRLEVTADRQGQKGFDDYALRLGVVEAGPRRLGFFERTFAADWVRKLYSLAPPGTGISQVRFFNLGVDPRQIGQQRWHPLSALLHETVIEVPRADGTFALEVPFEPPIETMALWIAVDGDDTGSSFTLVIEAIELETPEATRSNE